MNLIDMKHEPAEGQCTPMPCGPSNEYPYGLRVTLNQEQLEALGLDALPPAGTKLRLEATAVVVRSSTEDPDADGDIDYVCVELQLTELGLEEDEAEETESTTDRSARQTKRMYGGKDSE